MDISSGRFQRLEIFKRLTIVKVNTRSFLSLRAFTLSIHHLSSTFIKKSHPFNLNRRLFVMYFILRNDCELAFEIGFDPGVQISPLACVS